MTSVSKIMKLVTPKIISEMGHSITPEKKVSLTKIIMAFIGLEGRSPKGKEDKPQKEDSLASKEKESSDSSLLPEQSKKIKKGKILTIYQKIISQESKRNSKLKKQFLENKGVLINKKQS